MVTKAKKKRPKRSSDLPGAADTAPTPAQAVKGIEPDDNATDAATGAATATTKGALVGGKPIGVRASKDTVPYLAGLVIKRHGLEAGVTPEMVAELDAARGKQKPDEAKAILAWAWHAVRGSLGQS